MNQFILPLQRGWGGSNRIHVGVSLWDACQGNSQVTKDALLLSKWMLYYQGLSYFQTTNTPSKKDCSLPYSRPYEDEGSGQ